MLARASLFAGLVDADPTLVGVVVAAVVAGAVVHLVLRVRRRRRPR